MYYSSQIFLLGAEFTRVYANVFGSLSDRREAPPRADAVPVVDARTAVDRSRRALADALRRTRAR